MTVDRARLLVALDDLDVQGLAGVDLADVPEVEVTDPIYALALDAAVDTNMATLELGIEATTYQPDAFPGVVYAGDAATVLVFGTGQLVVVDPDSREAAETGVATVVARLVQTGLVDSGAVPEAGAEPVTLPPTEALPDEVHDAAAVAEAELTCPSCDHELDGTENFCPSCGADLS
jgi:RNA polymerase subunit RPABC4/transcription elongation factor Spt4